MNCNINEQKIELAVIGAKYDLKFEKKLDKNYIFHKKTQLIQKIWRGYKGR